MPSPLVTERIVRAILRAFVHAGTITSYTDIAKIEAIPANATDTDIDAVLSTITFHSGTVSTTAEDILRGTGDVNVFIDSDNNDNPLINARFFRVSQDQADPPVTDQTRELLTLRRGVITGSLLGSILTVGAQSSLVTTGGHTSQIKLAATSSAYQGVIEAGPSSVAGGSGMMLTTLVRLGISGHHFTVYDATGTNTRGGFSFLNSGARFHVGDVANNKTIIMEADPYDPNTMFTIRTSDTTSSTLNRIYIRGSRSGGTYAYQTHVIIGARPEDAHGDPFNLGRAALAVSGRSGDNTISNLLFLNDYQSGRPVGSEIFTIKSATTNTTDYYLFRAYVGGTAICRIHSDGRAYITTSWGTGPGDVAEHIVTDQDYEPGTVLVHQNGVVTASTSYAQRSVLGVVSTKPGVELGDHNLYDGSRSFECTVVTCDIQAKHLEVKGIVDGVGTHVEIGENHFVEILFLAQKNSNTILMLAEQVDLVPGRVIRCGFVKAPHSSLLAVSGIVPVKCSTAFGNIFGDGDLLVSESGGIAVLALGPIQGAVIGKAMSPLIQNGYEPVTGMVQMLVALM